MARIAAQEATLRDGSKVTLRCPEPRDAAAVNAFLIRSFRDNDTLIHQPDEYRVSTWQQRRRIAIRLDEPNVLAVVAERNGRILGHIDTLLDNRRRVRHNIEFGLAIAAEEQGNGMGRALLATYLAWARENPEIQRVTLHVHASNASAIHLYRTFGFSEEGRITAGIQVRPGEFVDNIIMGLVFEPKELAS